MDLFVPGNRPPAMMKSACSPAPPGTEPRMKRAVNGGYNRSLTVAAPFRGCATATLIQPGRASVTSAYFGFFSVSLVPTASASKVITASALYLR